MKAFVGHSFAPEDRIIVDKIYKFLLKQFECETAEEPENKSIAEKVKEKILRNEIFIGIFTRDRQICSNNVFLNLFGEKNYTTSNWVIQESGFAIGNKRTLIFIVEKGVYKFPELQGDLEYLPFERNKLDELFINLSNVVKEIKGEAKESGLKETSDKIKPENPVSDLVSQEEKEKKEVQGGAEDLKQELFNFLFIERDYKKLSDFYFNKYRQTLEEKDRPVWDAIIYKYAAGYGDPTAFDNLLKVVNDNKENPKVVLRLALRYKEMREYEKAKDTYLIIAGLYDKNNPDSLNDILDNYEQAAICLTNNNNYQEASKLILDLFSISSYSALKGKLFSILANISKISKNIDLFIAYAEASLDINPSNTELRFDLAYQYSEMGHHKISLLHYIKFNSAKESSSGLNNLAVEYDKFDLKAKSIENYEKAAELKETLAMANLAQRYLDEGFVKNATILISNANELQKEGVEVHGNIGLAKNRINTISKNESEKENEIIKTAELERRFRVEYANEMCSNKVLEKEKIEGAWTTPWGEISIIYDISSKKIASTNTTKMKDDSLSALLANKQTGHEYYMERRITINGDMCNTSGAYKIKIEDKKEYQTTYEVIYEAVGLLFLIDNKIKTMEKVNDEKLNIAEWAKKSPKS